MTRQKSGAGVTSAKRGASTTTRETSRGGARKSPKGGASTTTGEASRGAARSSPAGAQLDADALLAALVLVPASYSRNRFFELYTDPAMRRLRRRASLLRSLVRDILAKKATRAVLTRLDGGYELAVTFAADGGARRTRVARGELVVIGTMLARVAARAPAADAALAAILAELGPDALSELGGLFTRLLERA